MPHDDQNILHIAPATELEEERIHTLLRACNARHWPKNMPSLSLTAQVEGELAGGVVAYLVADTVEVEYLFVQERFRGRDIARDLLARVESQAQERGAKKIPQHVWLPGSGPIPAPRLPRGSYHRRRTRHQLAHLPQAHPVIESRGIYKPSYV